MKPPDMACGPFFLMTWTRLKKSIGLLPMLLACPAYAWFGCFSDFYTLSIL